jgi:polyvinyl alcohol dehydrogenase (cytochrome)
VGPGGTLGGMEFGSAVDGERIYTAITNFDHTPFKVVAGAHAGETVNGGIWSALDAGTGKIIWQTPDPSSFLPLKGLMLHALWGVGLGPGFFGVDMGPVTVANGVMFAGSMDQEGHMYGLDAHTGDILWSFASGGSVMSAPAVVDGVVYWGSGYDKGFNNNTFYAFGLPDSVTTGR